MAFENDAFIKFEFIFQFSGEQIWIEALGNEDCVSGDTVIKGLERNSLTPKKINKKASHGFEKYN